MKKLKGGRNVRRSHRIIRNAKTTIEGSVITVDFDHRWANGQMVGAIDTAKGTLSLNEKSLELKGYLYGRKFELIGYTPVASITNTNRRSTPGKL
jgi:hypothetical protein